MRPSQAGPTVHGRLDGAEQILNPLHFIQSHDAGKTFRKIVRTLGGGNAALAFFKADKTAPVLEDGQTQSLTCIHGMILLDLIFNKPIRKGLY